MSDDLEDLFGADGPLASALPGYRVRDGQLAMAREVSGAMQTRSTLVVEAGTGTDKTYPYLVPALSSGRRVIISTGTRALQDQLYHRDLSQVCRALGRPVRIALLKGRANYLCIVLCCDFVWRCELMAFVMVLFFQRPWCERRVR